MRHSKKERMAAATAWILVADGIEERGETTDRLEAERAARREVCGEFGITDEELSAWDRELGYP